MKKFIETITNIFKIEDLRKRILYTLLIILIYRLGTHIVLPGVNPGALSAFTKQSSEGLMGMLDLFSGGAFSKASIFALGIMPYISASIVIQLLTLVVPYFQRLQKEGESGRKQINKITRYLTILVVAIQAPAYIGNLSGRYGSAALSQTMVNTTLFGIPSTSVFGISVFAFVSFILLICATLFLMWLGEKITDKGIGNGISMIIMVGIIARFPSALRYEFEARVTENGGGPIVFIIELLVMLLVILFSIMLVQGTRRIPVQYAKRIVGNKQYGGTRNFLPLKVNAAGVMPIIFAQALMMLPITFISMADFREGGFGYSFIQDVRER